MVDSLGCVFSQSRRLKPNEFSNLSGLISLCFRPSRDLISQKFSNHSGLIKLCQAILEIWYPKIFQKWCPGQIMCLVILKIPKSTWSKISKNQFCQFCSILSFEMNNFVIYQLQYFQKVSNIPEDSLQCFIRHWTLLFSSVHSHRYKFH